MHNKYFYLNFKVKNITGKMAFSVFQVKFSISIYNLHIVSYAFYLELFFYHNYVYNL